MGGFNGEQDAGLLRWTREVLVGAALALILVILLGG